MADLIKAASLVKIATIRKSDLAQISICNGFYVDSGGVPFQQEHGKKRRELDVIGWFREGSIVSLLLQREDGRLMTRGLPYSQGKLAQDRYPQLFVR